jgi:urease accessory protein
VKTQHYGIALSAFFLLLLLFSPAAQAHPGHESVETYGGFITGFLHPLGGIDHLLAMVAVGLWAAQIGGRALWAVPASFLVAMLAGGLLGFGTTGFPLMEQGIAASVFVLGLLIALAIRPPLLVPVLLVAFFAVFHGAAHGAELPAGLGAGTYATGFLMATAFLHAAGLALGMLAANRVPVFIPRFAGSLVALCGLVLFFQTLTA